MSLLSKGVEEAIPAIYATEKVPLEYKMAIVKLFHPTSDWTWYIVEYDGQDQCFGYVVGHEAEFGYFSLAELEAIGQRGTVPPVERDMNFKPTPLVEITG